MNSKTHSTDDLSDHRRKIFFEHLNPATTRQSLKKYLSAFEVDACVVPQKDGKSASHGLVTFSRETNVDSVMSQRPHSIDGFFVEVYRSVPGQGSLKEKKGIKYLLVSNLKISSIAQSDLNAYFSGFGKIIQIKMSTDQDSSQIEFEDYDSVDKALLSRPIIIRNTEVNITKGDRHGRWNYNPPASPSVIQKKSNLKQVQIDPQVSSLDMPKKIYRIHITKLSSDVDASQLSQALNYNIANILMSCSSTEQSTTTECWLKKFDDREAAEEFRTYWNQQMMFGKRIECEVEEDHIEFCNKYRVGNCLKTDNECDWEHVMCTANGKCSNDCQYGHKPGTKFPSDNDYVRQTYQLKITGIQRGNGDQTSVLVSREKNFAFDDRQTNVGYVRYILTIKYAQRLLTKWHNRSTNGEPLKCQIELSQRNSLSKASSRSNSLADLKTGNTNYSHSDRGRSSWTNNGSRNNSRNSSVSRGGSDSELRVADEHEFSFAAKAYQNSVDIITNQKLIDDKRKSKSVDNLIVLDQSQHTSGRRSKKIQNGNNSTHSVFLIEYDLIHRRIYEKELNALKLLTSVQGVVQLINLQNGFDYKNDQLANNKSLLIPTQYPSGYTLREFVNRIRRGGFRILEAIHLIQILIKIVKDIHSKGVLHQNLAPENIFIDWDDKTTSAEQATFTLTDFSQAHIAEKNYRIKESTDTYWYQAPQFQDEILKYSSTIDASGLCALLLWLLTNVDPKHDENFLPHQNEDIMTKLNNKIASAVRESNNTGKHQIEETQVKTYLIDTFNIAFGYPHQQPWTINDFECRLESIRELLLSRNHNLDSIDVVIDKMISMHDKESSSTQCSSSSDTFNKAANAFHQAKSEFIKTNNNCSWSDGGCIWLHNTQVSLNEYRHDDILTFDRYHGRQLITQSFIITSFITLSLEKDCITLSIGSTMNGKMIRMPIGCYSKSQNYIGDFQKNFTIELHRLLISIVKERQAMIQL